MRFAGDAARCISLELPFANVNRDHPIVRASGEPHYLERPSDFHIFAHGLVDLLSGSKFRQALATRRRTSTWNFRWLGHHYRAVDWRLIPPEMSPPYSVWLGPEKGILDVTCQHFERWLTLAPSPSDRDAIRADQQDDEDT